MKKRYDVMSKVSITIIQSENKDWMTHVSLCVIFDGFSEIIIAMVNDVLKIDHNFRLFSVS